MLFPIYSQENRYISSCNSSRLLSSGPLSGKSLGTKHDYNLGLINRLNYTWEVAKKMILKK